MFRILTSSMHFDRSRPFMVAGNEAFWRSDALHGNLRWV
jgi:hypothetical protein